MINCTKANKVIPAIKLKPESICSIEIPYVLSIKIRIKTSLTAIPVEAVANMAKGFFKYIVRTISIVRISNIF
jgi:hypothetical protein